jgi:1-phosphofructokinase
MKITTLTLNPAYDVHVKIENFLTGRENLADSVIRDIGGKGINISRALNANGVVNRAIILLGKENAADFRAGLISEKLDFIEVGIAGRIRENITIHPENGAETRLSFRGFECPPGMLSEIERFIDAGEGDIVTFTGSLPVGMTPAEAECFLCGLRKRGVRLVIDSKSITLDSLKRIKPWLIKPNIEEIMQYIGETDKSILPEIAAKLHNDGIENVMISLGDDGAILATCGGIFRAIVPKVDALSTIGAGDSSIAGFISAFVSGKNAAEMLRTAVSFGTAACLTDGTNPPRSEDIGHICSQVKLIRL